MDDRDQWGTYVEARDRLPVRAWVRGFEVDAVVLGWSGQQVYVTWSTGPGMRHLGWVAAPDVERIERAQPVGSQQAEAPQQEHRPRGRREGH